MRTKLSNSHQNLQVEYICTSSLEPDPRNARTHSKRQITKLANIVREFGFANPILIDEQF